MTERVPVLVERSWLVRRIQRYRVLVEVDPNAHDKVEAAHYTARHAIDEHFTAFDEDVRNSELVSESEREMPEPLELEVVLPESAKIIPMRRPT